MERTDNLDDLLIIMKNEWHTEDQLLPDENNDVTSYIEYRTSFFPPWIERIWFSIRYTRSWPALISEASLPVSLKHKLTEWIVRLGTTAPGTSTQTQFSRNFNTNSFFFNPPPLPWFEFSYSEYIWGFVQQD